MPDVIAFAPGRVNLIGEHTDYNQGLALPFAIAAGITVHACRTADGAIEALALDLDERDSFPAASPEPVDGWRAFARGAAAELARGGVQIGGARLEISGDLAPGAGLSSSAALEVALALAMLALSGAVMPDRLRLAEICSAIENDWVGARTGLLDQLASLFGEPERALLIDFRSLEVEPIPLELDGHRLLMLDSGDRHELGARSGYERRRQECSRASELLGLDSLRDATLDQAAGLPAPLDRRVAHVVSENARVEQAVAALRRGDIERLGRLLDESHASLRDDYEVSTPAVDDAVARLRSAGAIGARLVGGGFGGHVLGLLPVDAAPPEGATEVTPGPGARVLAG